jgi:hypothetical protein
MRPLFFSAALAALLLTRTPAARADEDHPDGAIAFVVGAATMFAGFAVGGTLVGASGDDSGKTEAGWLIMESGFALAPFTSHAAVGEWGRGALFASVPTLTTLGTLPVFAADGAAVDHGTLDAQRAMWGLFLGGLVTSIVGVVDASFAPARAIQVAPSVGPRTAGLVIGGAL